MFGSDNAAPAHPKILAALAQANAGMAPSYGGDALTTRAQTLLREVFEKDCDDFMVATGSAANGLSLAALCPPWGAVLTHRYAHVVEDEAGAPGFFTAGAQLLLLDGPHTKLTPESLDGEAARWRPDWVHGAQPFAVTISQATESGASYTPEEIKALSAVCRARGLKLHMDGARFANAVAFTGASPADLTWKSGVDVLSFGATKNGALACEAIVCFDKEAARALPHLRKRAGQLLSKHRYMAAQMCAYLEDDLWLQLAAHANAMAAQLGDVFAEAGALLLHPVEANEVFVRLDAIQADRLRAAGASFYPWHPDGPDGFRFVCAWDTRAEDVERMRAALVL
jgi:threonine aldolase